MYLPGQSSKNFRRPHFKAGLKKTFRKWPQFGSVNPSSLTQKIDISGEVCFQVHFTNCHNVLSACQAEKRCRKKRPMDEEKWFVKMLWSGLGLRRWICWKLVKSWFLPQWCDVVNRINTEVVIYMNVGVPPPPNSSDHVRLHYIFSRGIRDPYQPLLYIVTGKGKHPNTNA